MTVMTSSPRLYEPISIGDILTRLWAGKWGLLFCSAVGIGIAVLYLHIATYRYTATLTLVPTQSQNQSGLGGLGGIGSSIAALTGMDVSSGGAVSPFILYPEALKSRVVADDLAMQSPDILKGLFTDELDKTTGEWREPEGTVHDLRTFAKNVLGIHIEAWAPPGGAVLQQVIVDQVRIVRDPRNPILKLSFDHPDPVFARRFLEALNASADRSLRQMTLDRSTKYMQYIQDRLGTVGLSDLRQVLITSLSEQMTLVMMASSNTPFAAQPLGFVESSNGPTQPKPILVLILGLVVGTLLGAAIVCGTLIHPEMSQFYAKITPRRMLRWGGQ